MKRHSDLYTTKVDKNSNNGEENNLQCKEFLSILNESACFRVAELSLLCSLINLPIQIGNSKS